MAPRQGARKQPSTVEDTSARESKIFKLASNIIDPNNLVRFKSLLNRDNKKDASTLKDPRLGLTLLQIAVIADNVPAGALAFFPCHSWGMLKASKLVSTRVLKGLSAAEEGQTTNKRLPFRMCLHG